MSPRVRRITLEDVPRHSLEIAGPWLLTRADLVDLGEMLDGVWSELLAAAVEESLVNPKDYDLKRLVNSAGTPENARALVEKHFEAAAWECKVTFSNDKIAREASLSQVMKAVVTDKAMRVARVKRIDMSMEVGDLKIAIVAHGNVNINTGYKASAAMSRIRDDVADWFEGHQSHRVVRWWREYSLLVVPVLWYVGFWAGGAFANVGSYVRKDPLADQAKALVNAGLKDADVPLILELLAKRVFGMVPEIRESLPTPGWFPIYLVMITVLGIVLLNPPKSCYGIGAGERSCRRWKSWLKFLGVGIPGYLILQVIVPGGIEKLLGW